MQTRASCKTPLIIYPALLLPTKSPPSIPRDLGPHLAIAFLLSRSDGIARLRPQRTLASVPESLHTIRVLAVFEHLVHLQRRNGSEDALGIHELLLRQEIAQCRGGHP